MKSKTLIQVLFAVYLLALVWIILFKMQISFAGLPHLRSVNLIPFAGSVITNGTADYDEIVGNILAFVPFGLFIGMLAEKKNFIRKAAPVFLTSLAFETAQFVFEIGASDITDLLANTLGGVMGIIVAAVLWKLLKGHTQKVFSVICLAAAVLLISFVGTLLLVNL